MNFSDINKASHNSFISQQKLIKKLCKGEAVLCHICQQPLHLELPSKNKAKKSINKSQVVPEFNKTYGVSCPKMCTDIQLEFD